MDALERAEDLHGRYFCRRCVEAGQVSPACERYTWGVYAGMYCDDCWVEDGRNHERQYDWMDAGEQLEEESC